MEEKGAESASARSRILIRRLAPGDWRNYRSIRLEALASDPLAFCTTLDEEMQCDEQRWVERSSLNSTSESQGIWIAYEESRPVGIAGMSSSEEGFSLRHMWVHPHFRGKGIGFSLASTAIEWVLSVNPSASIRLEVNPTQTAAVRLYERLGFIKTGKKEKLPHTAGHMTIEMLLKREPARARI